MKEQRYGWVMVAIGALMTCVAIGEYAWLYLGSFALGLGAVAIALAFPPTARRAQLQPA